MADDTDELPDEVWKPVVRFEGFYEVSSAGRVRSVDREFVRADGRRQCRNGRMLKPTLSGPTRAYLSVTLRHGHRRAVHILVCEAFHGGRPAAAYEAAHWDGNSYNNHASNLRWATKAENNADQRRHGTWRPPPKKGGERAANAHLRWSDVDAIRSAVAAGESQRALARRFDIGKSQVHNIVSGKCWDERWRDPSWTLEATT